MKKFETDKIRNIVLVGHQSCGKTMLGEVALFNAGVINRIGKIEDGNTVLDSAPDEIERQISINASLASFEHGNYKINLLDSPGYEDFVGEVASALEVVESAIVVISADSGVEVGTERVWKFLENRGLPRIVCINRMDKEHADYDKCLADAQKTLGAKVMPLVLPIGLGTTFKGVVDLLNKKAFIYSDGGKFTEEEIPADMAAQVDEARQALMDFAAEADDSLLEKFLESGQLNDEELARGIAAGCSAGTLAPLVVTSATSNIGIKQLLDMVTSLMPSPLWREEVAILTDSGETKMIKAGSSESVLGFVFKSLSEKHLGDLSFIRAFSGEISGGNELYDSNAESGERIGQLYVIQGKERKEIDSIPAGDIGAAVKLKSSKVNHTLSTKAERTILKGIDFPAPSLYTAIETEAKGDMDKVGAGLHRLVEEDPSFHIDVNQELHQTILAGQGELHFEVILAKLHRKYGVEVNMIPPGIPYRETITAMAEAQGKHKKQSGGRGQFGDVWLRLEPVTREDGFEFVSAIVGGAVPSKFIPAVEKGVIDAMVDGVVAGYKFQDVKVTIYDGSFHSVDSSDAAFKMAGSKGFRAAVKEAKPVILEPIYDVEVVVPEEYMGDVMGDMSMRRGKIQGTEQDGKMQKVKAQVPLSELYKYATSLRSMTQGRALHTRKYSHYEIVPHELAQKLIAEAKAAKEE
ncbi:MAG: elongation factor G [Candidatus Krumholzibacteria bacterium]|nr:elongation factor G [Candidatus Krumholzibacteria bacterium]